MKNRQIFVSLFVAVSMIIAAGLLQVFAAPAAPAAPAVAKKFTPIEIKKARAAVKKPQLVLSWETRAKLANDALARDAAALKSAVDGVLERANRKYTDCSGKDYTVDDLQKLCKPNESVQDCMSRLTSNCMMANSAQQWSDQIANMMAGLNIQTSLANIRKDADNLEKALFK